MSHLENVLKQILNNLKALDIAISQISTREAQMLLPVVDAILLTAKSVRHTLDERTGKVVFVEYTIVKAGEIKEIKVSMP